MSKEDKIMARNRIMASLRASEPKALTAKAHKNSSQIYWKKLLETLNAMTEDKKIEKIETSTDPVYRIKR